MSDARRTWARRTAAPAIALAALLHLPAPAMAQDAEREVLAVLDRWAAAYSAADASPEQMLELYHPESVFWGTGAREPFVGADEIGPYFALQFGNRRDGRVSLIAPIIRVYDGTATATGLYRFEVTTLPGDLVDVTHRFSFTLHSGDGGWIIVHQHSSPLPR